MRIRFIWPGKTKEGHLRALVSDYLKRLSRFARCEVVETREGTARDPAGVEKESLRILAAIPAGSQLVLLDLKGREWSSPELAAQVQRWENDSVKEVAIVIGGPRGVGAEVVAPRPADW